MQVPSNNIEWLPCPGAMRASLITTETTIQLNVLSVFDMTCIYDITSNKELRPQRSKCLVLSRIQTCIASARYIQLVLERIRSGLLRNSVHSGMSWAFPELLVSCGIAGPFRNGIYMCPREEKLCLLNPPLAQLSHC